MRTDTLTASSAGSWLRAASALPDAVTAAVFLLLWAAPFALGESGVRNAMLMMLVEFVLVHASGFLGGFVLGDDTARGKRLMILVGFGLFYLMFIGAFVLAFREWWPLAAFAWLLAGKFAVVIGGGGNEAQRARMMAGWALAAVFYLVGVFATAFLPLPRLGLQAELLPALGLKGEGVWIEEPHRVIAFGAFYFGISAWSKWRGWLLPASAKTRA